MKTTKTKDSHKVDNGFKDRMFDYSEAIRPVSNCGFIGLQPRGAWKGQSKGKQNVLLSETVELQPLSSL